MRHWIRRWNELLLVPAILLLILASNYLIPLLDETAAVFDLGVLQRYLYAAIGTFWQLLVVWVALKLTFPRVHQYLYEEFESQQYEETCINKPLIRSSIALLLTCLLLAVYSVNLAVM